GATVEEIQEEEEEVMHPIYNALIKHLVEYKTEYMEELSDSEESVHKAHMFGINFILITTVFITLLAAIISMFTARLITKPLYALQRGSEIIGEGNLDHKVGTQKNDEIGKLSRVFDQMVENIKKKNREITASKERAENAVEEINEAVIKVAVGDYSVQARVSDENDIYDSLAMGVNMMINDIGSTMSEQKRAENQLKAANQQLEASEQQQKAINYNLQERMKEINCLYGVSDLDDGERQLDEIIQSTVELLPPSFQYPE
ncbi:unnamed protein product, partial [marine sediment metagenome]